MNAITYYSKAIKKVDEGEITIGEYERMINVLRDVEPVVRCRDCKHHHYKGKHPYCGRYLDDFFGWSDDDFCSRGERKDGNDD